MCGLKSKMWLRDIDDTFVQWHGEDMLKKFLKNLNSIHTNIQFMKETEKSEQLPFLNIQVKK